MKFLLAIPFLIASANAATLIYDDFSGSGASPLNGTSPDINTLSASIWSASSLVAASGQVTDGTNTDRGATLDLGAGFAFQTNQTYTLTLGWSNLDNAILFAGFSTVAMNVDTQVQTQPSNFAVRVRAVTPTAGIAAWAGLTATTGSSVNPAGAGSATMTITTNSLTNATFAVDGVASTAVNLTGYRYLYLGFEDPAAASPASDAQFTSIEFSAVPEPSGAMLGSLVLLALFRRRR